MRAIPIPIRKRILELYERGRSTREIAQSFPGVRVTAAPPLPAGCSGKCNAAQSGAELARAPWLLFTDADTVHRPGSLARALAEAIKSLAGNPEQGREMGLKGREYLEENFSRAVIGEKLVQLLEREILSRKS